MPVELDEKGRSDGRSARNQHHEPGGTIAGIGKGEGQAADFAAFGHGEITVKQGAFAAARTGSAYAGTEGRQRRIRGFIGQGVYS